MQIKIYHISGDENPKGLRKIQIFNKTIIAYALKREYLNKYTDLEDSHLQGVYMLLEDEACQSNDLPRLYVGEGQNSGKRLDEQRRETEWWDIAIVFCAKDNCIDRCYLEKRLYEKAKAAGKYCVENITPKGSPLTDQGDIWAHEQFLDDIEFLLDSPLGIDALEMQETSVPDQFLSEDSIVFKQTHVQSYPAQMIILNGEYVVLKGSFAAKTEQNSCPVPIINERRRLIEQGILVFNEIRDCYEFQSDTIFKSPTRAGQIVYGANFPGRKGWTYRGASLAECEEKGLI